MSYRRPLALPLLLLAAVVALACGRVEHSGGEGAPPPAGAVEPTGSRGGAEAIRPPGFDGARPPAEALSPGVDREASLAPGECDAYRPEPALEAGDALRFRVDQLDLDVRVAVETPEGGRWVFDGPTASVGTEVGRVLMPSGGSLRLEICAAAGKGAAGAYRLRIEVASPATPEDRLAVDAHDLYRRGWEREQAGAGSAAADFYQWAGDQWRRAGEDRGALWVELKLASLARSGRIGQGAPEGLERAAHHYGRAAELACRLGDLRVEGRAHLQRGRVERLRGRLAAAAESYRLALQRAEAAGAAGDRRLALNDLAVAHGEQGDSATALAHYHDLLDAWRDVGDRSAEARTLSSMGAVHLNVGEPQQARRLFERALERAGPRAAAGLRADLLEQQGRAFLALEELEAALASFDAALALRQNRYERAVTSNNRGRVLRRLGRTGEARQALDEALAAARGEGAQGLEATVRLNLAALLEEGDPAAAAAHCEAARSFFTRPGVADENGAASALFCLARTAERQGRREEALKWIGNCLERLERLRGQTLHPAQRASYLADRRKYLDFRVALLVDAGGKEPEEEEVLASFLAAEQARARTLYEALQGKEDDEAEALRAEEREVRAAMEAARTTAALATSEAERRQTLHRLDLLLERYRILTARIEGATAALPPPLGSGDLSSLRRQLGEDTRILAFHLAGERTFAWVLGRDRAVVEELATPPRKLEEQADWLHFLLGRGGGVASATAVELALDRLAGMILDPLADHLGGSRLLLLPDGVLHSVPFAALPLPAAADGTGPRRLLVDDFELVHVPSLGILEPLRRRSARRPEPGRTLALFADPVFGAADERLGSLEERPLPSPLPGQEPLPRLEGTRREARRIESLVPEVERRTWMGFEARREALLAPEVADFRILHLATHALVDPVRPELSGIVLSRFDGAGLPRGGFVPAWELAQLDLSARLVVLSACRTALGREVRGEGRIGLTRGFLGAGVPQLLVSLWDVGDDGTAELMGLFYEGLLVDGLSAPAALARAQRTLAHHPGTASPYAWAGFVLQGDWR